MADKIDFFWELFTAVSGGTGEGITDVLDALAKSDRAKVESYFSNVIDQVSFGTLDYNRFRNLLIDLFATHRTLASQSASSTDPHSLTNSDLDELFRSFGYPESSQLRGFDENPLEQKIQFFLDLVNLYKVKGTPQSLVDVLQYYGVTSVDIYEFMLKLKQANELIFYGKGVAGTSVDPTDLQFPYANLTANDPHWLYTEQQILNLNSTLKINLPSKTPYIGVQPIVDLDGVEFSLFSRNVQDQYAYWQAHGTVPPPNAEITFIGEVKSLLELYLSTIYMFNKNFDAGADQDPCNFMCYDGTKTNAIEILSDFTTLTSPPIRRCDLNDNAYVYDSTSGIYVPSSYCSDSKLAEFYDTFTRPSSTNFLVNKNSAGIILNSINPTLKSELDSAGEPLEVFYSLLKDLAVWVRTNIGYGFVSYGYIVFGLNQFFKDLKPVIDFFKPYRARLLLIELLRIKNRLFNTIKIEDSMRTDINLEFHDFATGDSTPCCTSDSTALTPCTGTTIKQCTRDFVGSQPTDVTWKGIWTSGTSYQLKDIVVSGIMPGDQFICTQAHVSNTDDSKPGYGSQWTLFWSLYTQISCTDSTAVSTVYSRETFDCGSYFDVGAVVDKDIFIEYQEDIHDHLRCPSDGTAFVVSEIIDSELLPDSTSVYNTYQYYQSGGFRDFDSEGTFDCTHGFDLVQITVVDLTIFMLQENGDFLLQEDGSGILLE